ncbi:hypothetical protein ACNKHV_18470 [Shigella flexneri]
MQVVQDTAGKDVFRSQGKSGTPSRSFRSILPAEFRPAPRIGDADNVDLAGIDNRDCGVMPSSPPITAAQAACCESFRMIIFRPPDY